MRTLAVLAFLACGGCWARADNSRPATSNVPRGEHPRIGPEEGQFVAIKTTHQALDEAGINHAITRTRRGQPRVGG